MNIMDNLITKLSFKAKEIVLEMKIRKLKDKLKTREQECEALERQLKEYKDEEPAIVNTIGNLKLQVNAWVEQSNKYARALDDIEKFIKSDMCGPCKESKEDSLEECNHSCEECNYKIILDTVNKSKGE